MDATIHPETVTSYDLEGWEIQAARYLLDGARLVTPAERTARVLDAGLPGVARAMEALSDVADESRDLIRAAARR